MLRIAMETVQLHVRALVLFLLITTLYFSAKLIVESQFVELVDFDANENQANIYVVVSSVLTAAIYAVAQSLAFSTFGREIEKPFWKVGTQRDALIRFFPLWMFLNLVNLLLLNSIPIFSSSSSNPNSLVLLWLVFSSTIIPMGATIMFYGNWGKEEIQLALSTFGHQLPRYFFICLFGFIVSNFLLSVIDEVPIYVRPFLVIVEGYFKCVIFVYAWFICRAHREMLEQSDDDFDF
jgi:hypothetical protein